MEWGKLRTVPVICWFRVPEQPFDFLVFEDAARLTSAADFPLWHTMIVGGLRTGRRQGELLALRWEDVDLAAGRLLVRRSVVDGDRRNPEERKGEGSATRGGGASYPQGIPSPARTLRLLRRERPHLGHATIEMTMCHAHLSRDVRRGAVKLLDGPSTPDEGAVQAHGTYAAHERRSKQK